MKKMLITLLLALAVCAGAVELYWDTGNFGGLRLSSDDYSAVGVCFNDDEGPGSTGGQVGTVYSFRAYYKVLGDDPAELWLYTVDMMLGPIPDEPLYDYPLDYEQDEDGGWTVYTLIEPKRVPEEFFAVIELPSQTEIYETDETRDQSHSAYFYIPNGFWSCESHDIRIRVEWEPLDTAVEKLSWGAIKTTK